MRRALSALFGLAALLLAGSADAQTRLYLADAPLDVGVTIAMPPSGWESQHTGAAVRDATRTVSVTSASPTSGGGSTANTNRIMRAHVSPALQGQTIAGTFKGQYRVAQSFGSDDRAPQIRVRVVSNDGVTARCTLVDFINTALSNEFTVTTLTNRKLPRGGSAAITSCAVQDGDRIVVETGNRKFTTAGSTTLFDYRDSAASDLPEDETTATALNSWVEFSQTLLFQGDIPPPATSTNDHSRIIGGVMRHRGSQPPVSPVNEFIVGQSIRTDDGGTSVNIRSTAGGTIVGSQAAGAYGTVVSGPTLANGAYYWDIDFLNGQSGFAPDLALVSSTAPGNLFLTGASVEVDITPSNIRATPAGTITGTHDAGEGCSITDGPIYHEGVSGFDNWWYECGSWALAPNTGWIGNNRLQTPAAPPALDIVPPTADTVVAVTGGISGGSGSTGSLANCISGAAAGTEFAPVVTKCVMPAGTITLTTLVTMTVGVGKTIIADFETNNPIVNITVDGAGLNFQGTLDATQTITALGTASGKTTMGLAIPAGWAAGQIVKVASLDGALPGIRIGSSGINNGRLGELMKISGLSCAAPCTGTVTFTEGMTLQNLYLLADRLRVARVRSGQLWLMGPRTTGNEAFDNAIHIRVSRMISPRIVRRSQSFAHNAFLSAAGNWEGIDYGFVLIHGDPDTSNGGSDGFRGTSNKRFLVVSNHILLNCTDFGECVDTDTSDQIAGSTDLTSYGYDYFTTVQDVIASQMRQGGAGSKGFSQHGGTYGITYLNDEEHQTVGTSYCMTMRGKHVSLDGFECDRPLGRGVQVGIGNDGIADTIDIQNSSFNTAGNTADVNTTASDPPYTVGNTTCNHAMSSLFVKTNSPGC